MPPVNKLDEDLGSGRIWFTVLAAVGARRNFGCVADTFATRPTRRNFERQRRETDVDSEQSRLGSIDAWNQRRLLAGAASLANSPEPGDSSFGRRAGGIAL